MKPLITVALLILFLGAPCGAQMAAPGGSLTAPGPATPETQQRLQLAISSEDYPVTPGDVYQLSFRQADTSVAIDFLVESNYTINMKVFGLVSARGMTFAQLKPIVEKAVSVAYPRSMPSLSIYSLGIFEVFLKGETAQSQSVIAWGMSHLSDILEGKLGPYSCLRNIKVLSANGSEQTYDLFQFQRLGIADQNPFVKSGDTVVISGRDRTIEIAGEIKRPGKYQLLPSDQLKEMIDFYGGGLTSAAETSRVRIDRVSSEKPSTLYVNLRDETGDDFSLEDSDIVTIPSKVSTLPVVFFEGAVLPETLHGAAATQAAQTVEAVGMLTSSGYNRLSYNFRQGETLKSALRVLKDSISPMANLSGAYLIREGISKPFPTDLAALLSGTGNAFDMPLWSFDRIIIPLLRFSVVVSGAVDKPGTYQYAPGQTYQFYVTLAGGNAQQAPEKVSITDSGGKIRDQKDVIHPEDQIFVMPETIKVQGAVFAPGSFSYRQGLPDSYYVNLAGGVDPERNGDGEVRVLDSSGNTRKTGEPIMPGDLIYVPNKAFSYQLIKYGPVIITILATIVDTIVIFSNWTHK